VARADDRRCERAVLLVATVRHTDTV
jgi:hypothetical protein